MNILLLMGFGLGIHIIFLFSIFDIYFKSPVLTSINAEINNINPPGKRVVLISVDGLRLDALFDTDRVTGKHVAEYIQNIMNYRGTWGVSQSHVPTESRPGHVAMLAGIYEDPSAITRGWKENPVDFDSIFNRSHCSFAWGSPDILNIFFKELKHNCAFMKHYKSEQNFAGDTREYDNWVYTNFITFMKDSLKSLVMYEEGIFFFFHLLGQDTSGHTDKPHTEKYRQNLKNVDDIVQKIEKDFYDFYGDDKTTFILTSDHGMSDWGSHGAGHSDETDTPFVAWGAGIRKPLVPPKQVNINQADIAPLLAVLLGISIPVNSVGLLPFKFLNMSRQQIAQAMELNARQMAAQYKKALENTKNHTINWLYKPYENLHLSDISLKFSYIMDAIKLGKYSEAINDSVTLINASLDGLDYYQNYYQKPLLLSISLSYIAWIFYLVLLLFKPSHSSSFCINSKLQVCFWLIVLSTILIITVQKLPFLFYAYMLLPEFLWYNVYKLACVSLPQMKTFDKTNCFFFPVLVLVGVEIFVNSFFKRWFLSISMGFNIFWVVSLHTIKSIKLMCLWVISGIIVALFSLLPIMGRQPNPHMTVASGCSLCFISILIHLGKNHGRGFLFSFRFIALALSTWNNYVIHCYFNENQRLLVFNQYLSWLLLLSTIFLLLFNIHDFLQQLIHVFTCLSIPFLLLSISYEGFFLLLLFVHLICWIFVEISLKNQNPIHSNFRIPYFFLTYIFLSFFGLGNISSLNSFDPAWVRCFITVFSPFLMSALILLKTIIPFLVVTCTMRVITATLNICPGRLFIVVLIYCNIMALNFLFFVKNKGSWLDIGISLSHYVIQQITIVFLVVLFGLAKVLTISSYYQKTTCTETNTFFPLPLHHDSFKINIFQRKVR